MGHPNTRRILILGFLAACLWAPAAAAELTGRIREKGTKAPLADAALLLEQNGGEANATYSAVVDAKGFYRVVDVPEGTYRLTVASQGFAKVVREGVTLPAAKPLDFFLERDGFTMPEVVVTAKRLPKTAVSRQVVTKDELSRVPGTAGDPLRALQSLPGVATAGDFSGQLLVRGGGPQDNAYFLDRIPLAFPFHFGGVISTINPELIKTVDFSTGGFGPAFGNFYGGIIDVTQRDVRKDRWGGRADINLLMTELMFEGPVSSKSALSISGRRSYLEIMKKAFGDFTAIPSFGDYQVKYDLNPSERTHWDFQAFGSDDKLGVVIKADSEAAQKDPSLAGNFEFHNAYHSQGVNYKHKLGDNDTLLSTPYHYKFIFDTQLGQDYYLNFGLESFGDRTDWLHDFGPDSQLRVGFQYDRQTATVDSLFVRMPSDGTPGFNFTDAEKVKSVLSSSYDLFGTYSEMRFTVGPRLKADAGVRYDLLTYNNRSSLSPRLSAAYDLGAQTTLKASWGLFRELPEGSQLDPNFGNKTLDASRAKGTVLGIEHEFAGGKLARLEGFDKKLDLIPVAVLTPDHYLNEGIGTARGFEVFLRQAPTTRFFGWISYTYSVSRRQDQPDMAWRYYEYDQRHIASIVGSYKLTPKWETGFKWHLASGEPETPIIGVIPPDSTHNFYIPVYASINSARKAPYHRLDLSISRTASYNTWRLRWYLEILNVYNSKNVVGYDYSADYSTRKEIKQLPFLPYFGVEAKF